MKITESDKWGDWQQDPYQPIKFRERKGMTLTLRIDDDFAILGISTKGTGQITHIDVQEDWTDVVHTFHDYCRILKSRAKMQAGLEFLKKEEKNED